jgi:nitrate/nitrite transporter NarK
VRLALKENVWKRLIGAFAGIAIGLATAIYLNQTCGYDIILPTFIIGAPLAAVLSRAYGGPLSESMGHEERSLTRRVKILAILLGVAASLALGALMGSLLNGVGLGVMLLVAVGPRLGLIFDERMGRMYGKAATNAFAVFSICAGYLGFYHMQMYPGQVTLDTFVAVIWISWASLVLSWLYYYFVGGE